jgi:hypothetical protein
LVLALPADVAGQRITITPAIAAYVPLVPHYRATDFRDQQCDGQPCPIQLYELGMQSAAGFGVVAMARLYRSFGLEASIATAGSSLRTTFTSNNSAPQELNAKRRSTVMALRAIVERPLGSSLAVSLGIGVARTTFSGQPGPGGSTLPATHQWGASAAAALDIAISSRLHSWLGVADNRYRVEQTFPAQATRPYQHDLLVSMGVRLVLLP